MTLQQYTDLLQDCTELDKQIGLFPVFVNEAIKELCRRRSWAKMKDVVTFTVLTGNGSAALPSNFKEPQSGINPLRGINVPNLVGGFDLWTLYSKQEIKRLVAIGCGVVDRKAYIDNVAGVATVFLQGQPGTDINFELDSYLFPADLALGTDHNFLTDDYPFLVLEQAKVFTYGQDGRNPDAPAQRDIAQKEVERLYSIAIQDDAYRTVRGRRFRMGGA